MTNLAEKLAESLKNNGVSLSYGPKESVDGHELIPVALVSYGFGGGSGSGSSGGDDSEVGEGEGGGGGGLSIPVGAYVGGPEGAVFRPNVVAVLAVSIPVIWTLGKAIARIVKAA
ncbi:hypothetical protein ACFSBZ_02100 [Amnibacterium flavum]|uniref:Sporulation protein YtfJ n=1 Tax=Amnibacterium flavum TaxID=2173173 RepID=A0A2V1HQP6_9MICO|nr:hypothetical protein [Amnibacterium flavum]PVZ94671.1 hypothetical protein DDQ50_13350 [Amnibacterium flavum]